jgi:hypothetical protein
VVPIEFALWGLAGGLMVEIIELAASTRRYKCWPWQVQDEMRFGPYLFCALTRPMVGAPLALALGSSDQISGPAGALIVGVSAPLIIQAALRQSGQAGPEVVPAGQVAAMAGPRGYEEPTADPEANRAAAAVELMGVTDVVG